MVVKKLLLLLLAVPFTQEDLPEVTNDGDQRQFVAIWNDLQLTCQYNASPPASEVLWKKDGTVIARNASVEINDSRVTIPHYKESHVQLTVSTTTSQDAGNYTCLVINDLGNSSDTTIIVIEGMFNCTKVVVCFLPQ
ncbi:pro-neuregulin-1, membrane-bound isoform-like [Oculina patagonica]